MKIDQQPESTRQKGPWILFLVIVGGILFYQFNRKTEDVPEGDSTFLDWKPAEIVKEPGPPPQAVIDQSEMFQSSLPLDQGPEGYVGGASCKECHEGEFESWHDTYHRSMTQVVGPETVVADFDRVRLEHNEEVFKLFKRNDEYWVRITDRQPVITGDAQGMYEQGIELRLSLVTGSHHMQVFWLPAFHGNMQIGFPFTWLIKDQKWVPRESAFIRDPHAVSKPEIWNLSCIRCHVTAGNPGQDLERDLTLSSSADLGISCEACHGPGEAHIAWQKELELSKTNAGSVPKGEDPIIHPEHLDHERSTQLCGQCHGMKWWDERENWRQTGFDYRPGDDLAQTTPIIQPTKIDEQPWLQEMVDKNPNLLRDFFWSDGMIRVSGREYNGLLESACHVRGKMSCISCHSLHDSDPNDMLAKGMEGNEACTQCHEGFEENLAAHTFHAPDSEGSKCYNCHMPHTTYSLLTAIRSHEIDSPNATVSRDTGRPNACNLCHIDRTLSWTAGHLQSRYGHELPELEEHDQNVSSVVVNLLKGDAGRRALAAWHLGWESSIQISGTEWQPRFLAELLDDPYSAVRYVAHKALQRFPGFEQFDYDFVAMPEFLEKAQAKAIQIWDQQHQMRTGQQVGSSILLDSDGQVKQQLYAEILNARDDSPIRLRE